MLKKTIYPLLLGALPFFALAQNPNFSSLNAFIDGVRDVVDALIPVVIGIGVLVFLWGLLKYVIAKSDEDRSDGRSVMFMGVIVIFVMVSLWGLVRFLQNVLGIGGASAPQAPGIPS
ncbi:MAG: hypothetical protein H7831_08110 [Magnetococcus sp. WYHC-3]